MFLQMKNDKRTVKRARICRISFSLLIPFLLALTACPSSTGPSAGGKTQIDKPVLAADSFVYDGSPHTVTLEPAAPEVYTLGGEVTQTDVGDYTATVTLHDTAAFE